MHNNLCLTIKNCNTSDGAVVVLNECESNNSQSECQGFNQKWIQTDVDRTIISELNGKW